MAGPPTPARVLIISQFYPPEAAAASNRVSAIARALADAGNDVTVVTGLPSFPDGVIPASFRARSSRVARDGAVAVTRVWTYASRRLRSVDRLLNWLSVSVGATAYVLTRRDPIDIAFVSSPPITLALPALAASVVRGARLVVDVRDVYPDVAIKMGVWKRGSIIARLVGAVADALYRRASLILTVTETCKAEIAGRGVALDKIVIAPNGFDRSDASATAPLVRGAGEFIIAYTGNMGIATGVGVVLDAALALRPQRRYRFVLVGGGADSDEVARRISGEGIDNVTLLGPQPRGVATAVMRQADVCVVPLKRGIVDSLPTKLLDALAVGTPVIVCADGEARAFVERSGGGLAVPSEDGTALAGAIGELSDDAVRLQRCAQSGLAYVTRHYDRANVVADISARVASLSPS